MSAINLPSGLSGLFSGSLNSGNTHPVTLPDVLIKYEQKDITSDIRPYFLSLSYTDYLEGQSDEIQLELEDVDGRWLRTWYPNQGDKLALQLGDQFTGMVKLGEFEIAEIEYRHPPSVVSLKALSTGISHASRTLKPKAYEHTTLANIVRLVARRLKLSVTGEIADIKIERITQYQERDVEFLARLAREYGHSFKIVGRTLVFTRNDKLAEQKAVGILLPADIKSIRLRDLIKGVPQEAVVSGYDAKRKTVRRRRRKHTPLREGSTRSKSWPPAARATSSSLPAPTPRWPPPRKTKWRATSRWWATPSWWPGRLCSSKDLGSFRGGIWSNRAATTSGAVAAIPPRWK